MDGCADPAQVLDPPPPAWNNEAVSALSSYDPLLGFQLRSKDIVNSIFHTLSSLEAEYATPIPLFTNLEQKFAEVLLPELDKQIKSLAASYGIWTRITTRNVFINSLGKASTTFKFSSAGSWYVRSIANPTPYNANSVWSPVERYNVR